MDDRELNNKPNPFEVFSHPAASRRRSLASAVKFFVGTAFLFCVVTASQLYWKRIHLSELVDGFSTKSSAEKIDHLSEFEKAGEAGIDGLVTALADDQPAVHEAALELLSDVQMHWLTLPSEELANRRQRLAEAIVEQARRCRDDRSARFRRLKRIAHTVAQQALDSNHEKTAPGVAAINDVVFSQLMHVKPSQSEQALSDSELVEANVPLPIDQMAQANWTDWPPTANESGVGLYRAQSKTNETRPNSIPSAPATNNPATSNDGSQPADLTPHGQVIAAQFMSTPDTNAPASSARLVRPTYGVQSVEAIRTDRSAVDAWIDRLASPSRFTRLKAVERLSGIGDAQSIIALRLQVQRETDQIVAYRMREAIEAHAEVTDK